MAQVFGRSADTWLRAIALVVAVIVVATLVGGWMALHSPWTTEVGATPPQPVPFSHRHHAGELKIDCRYCHYTVETESVAGWPTSELCMTCHSQLWTEADMLEPLRTSFTTGEPLRWSRIVDLPEFVYFDHGVHVSNGVGCASCHGRIDTMAMTYQAEALTMSFCLDCHRDPAPHLRPLDAVTDMAWKPPENQDVIGRTFMEARDVHPDRLTDCYTCHR